MSDGVPILGNAVQPQRLACLVFHFRVHRPDAGERLLTELRLVRSDVVMLDVGHEQAHGADIARLPGDQDSRNAELFGDGDGVQRTRPTEGRQGEVSRIVAPLCGDLPDCARHVGRYDLGDALGQAVYVRDTDLLT